VARHGFSFTPLRSWTAQFWYGIVGMELPYYKQSLHRHGWMIVDS